MGEIKVDKSYSRRTGFVFRLVLMQKVVMVMVVSVAVALALAFGKKPVDATHRAGCCEDRGSRARNNREAVLELQQPDHSVYHVELRLCCTPFPTAIHGSIFLFFTRGRNSSAF